MFLDQVEPLLGYQSLFSFSKKFMEKLKITKKTKKYNKYINVNVFQGSFRQFWNQIYILIQVFI